MREIKGENIIRNFFLIFGGLLLLFFIGVFLLGVVSVIFSLMGW